MQAEQKITSHDIGSCLLYCDGCNLRQLTENTQSNLYISGPSLRRNTYSVNFAGNCSRMLYPLCTSFFYLSPLPAKKVSKRCQHVKGLSPVDSHTFVRHLKTKHNLYLHALRKAVLPQACASSQEQWSASDATGCCYWHFCSPSWSEGICLRCLSLSEIWCQVSLQHPFLINNVQDD